MRSSAGTDNATQAACGCRVWLAAVIAIAVSLLPACTPRPHDVVAAFCSALADGRYTRAADFCMPGVIASVTGAPVAAAALQSDVEQVQWQLHDLFWIRDGLTAVVSFDIRHSGPPPPEVDGVAQLLLCKQRRRWRIAEITLEVPMYVEFVPADERHDVPQHVVHVGDGKPRQRRQSALHESLAAFMQRYDRYCRSFTE